MQKLPPPRYFFTSFFLVLKFALLIFHVQNSYPVKKLLEANDNTVRNFKKFDGKNRFFSIFLKLSQTVSSDAKMVPKCFETLKVTPKASGYILGSFEKKFSDRTLDLQKPIFPYVATRPS